VFFVVLVFKNNQMEEINKDVRIREISFGSEDYSNELKIRDEVLRKPLGMSLYNDNLDVDRNDTHIGAFMGNQLVGVLILTRINANILKMRQVAVTEKLQSKHIGTDMVKFAEDYAHEKGFKIMQLNARKTAVAFYEKQGYEKISDEFLEINIPHYKMAKTIG
jgi:predicted GNAT family N-acyltransferase